MISANMDTVIHVCSSGGEVIPVSDGHDMLGKISDILDKFVYKQIKMQLTI